MTNHVNELMKAAGVEKMPVKGYPLFTPEKQLELIKLILKDEKNYSLEQRFGEVWDCYAFDWTDATDAYADCITVSNECYELALAELVLILINENKLDKSEVRRILEDG